MKPPAYFARAAGLRSALPYLVPPRAHGRVPVPAEMALASPDAERPQGSAAPRQTVASAPAAATVVTSSGAKRTAAREVPRERSAPATPEVVTEHASALEAPVVPSVPADRRFRRPSAPAGPVEDVSAPGPQALPRRPAARSIVAADAPATTPRRAADTAAHEIAHPAVPREQSSPRHDGDPVTALRPLTAAAARRTPQSASDAAAQPSDEPSRPRREQVAAAREPLPPPLDLPAPRPRPAPSPSPRASGSSGEVRIGTLEVRVVPPAAEPQPPAVVIAAPAAPSAPLARGFASSIGIRQA